MIFTAYLIFIFAFLLIFHIFYIFFCFFILKINFFVYNNQTCYILFLYHYILLYLGANMLILKGFKNFLYDLYHNRTAILVILIYIVITQVLFHTVCPIAIIFGFPCPACGLTRAGICLLTGRFWSAFYMNPCIFLLVPYFFYLWIFKYILEKKPSFLTPVTISLSIAVISIYIIRIWTHTLPEISMRGAFVFHYFINISSFIQTYFHTDYFTIL